VAGLAQPLDGLRIGVPREYFGDGLDARWKRSCAPRWRTYEQLGATLVDITLPRTHLAIPAYYIVAPAEASTNLSRYDGVRYGHRCDNPADLQDLYTRSREEGFGDEVQRRILVGTYTLSSGYYDAYYRKAQQLRRLIAEDFASAFEQVDVIAGPTAPGHGVSPWREDRRPDGDVLRGHLHPGREPRRAAGDQPARGVRRRPPRGPAADRPPLRRGAPPRLRAPLPAAQRLAPAGTALQGGNAA
jgi:Asp-tRNA(Asn)/Glu-tRNA(Gln) amidotransferase A subunit family amidase